MRAIRMSTSRARLAQSRDRSEIACRPRDRARRTRRQTTVAPGARREPTQATAADHRPQRRPLAQTVSAAEAAAIVRARLCRRRWPLPAAWRSTQRRPQSQERQPAAASVSRADSGWSVLKERVYLLPRQARPAVEADELDEKRQR